LQVFKYALLFYKALSVTPAFCIESENTESVSWIYMPVLLLHCFLTLPKAGSNHINRLIQTVFSKLLLRFSAYQSHLTIKGHKLIAYVLW